MTRAEAMKRFGIKETDPISEDGIRFLLHNAEQSAKTWSLSSGMRSDLEKDIEAYKALLEG